MTPAARPLGEATRGTTGQNRLRRVDRWITGTQARRLRQAADPLVVDLGYGASAVTTVELFDRLVRVRPDVEVVGIEIDQGRVAAAKPYEVPGLSFRRGGFELPLDGRSPVLIKAMNVLRQYDETRVGEAWRVLADRLGPGGLLVEGTCDEPGRRASWVGVAADGPETLTLAARLASLSTPSDLAERLPKALIHRNVPGESVHRLLTALDLSWATAAPYAAFGPRQRWIQAVVGLRDLGWPVVDSAARWRLGEVTVDWAAVAPSHRRPERD